jgi:hypothetical protein
MRLGFVSLAFRCSIIDGQAQEHTTDEAKKIAWLTVEFPSGRSSTQAL